MLGRAHLSGYRLTLSSNNENDGSVVEVVPAGVEHRIFGLDRVKANVHYTVRVVALYDDGEVEADPFDCHDVATCGGSLACIPDDTTDNTCGCKSTELHTMNLVEGVPPEAWGCHRCLPGLVCRGGTAESTGTAKGWFIGSTLNLTTAESAVTGSTETASKRASLDKARSFPSLHPCAKEGACPGQFQVSRLIGAGADVDVLFEQCK